MKQNMKQSTMQTANQTRSQGTNVNTYTILIADDEPEIRDILRIYLEKENYNIIEAATGIEAAAIMESEQGQDINMAILDVMMPGIDGFHLLKKIRETSNIPVLILSAKTEDADKILGLGLGADDYLGKPFNPLELIARVQSNLRRFYSLGSCQAKLDTLTVRDLMLDLNSCMLYRGETAIELTSVEFKIMKLFMEHPQKVFTKQQLFEHGWDEEFIVADNNIMVCISKLRAKLAEDGNLYIKTIRGLGYRLEK
ncbi:MAG: response regulator transcription factor [Lachnospiraceae bacterium]